MHFFTLALAALAALGSAAPAGDFEILTCTAGSIKVKTDYNTAFVLSDPAYTKYGAATQSVPLNGCADLSAVFKAYTGQASAGATPKSSKKCTISGAPETSTAELHVIATSPYFQLTNASGVTVKCV